MANHIRRDGTVQLGPDIYDEYSRNCRKNIRQHPERTSHWIEADPRVILAMIERIASLENEVQSFDDWLADKPASST